MNKEEILNQIKEGFGNPLLELAKINEELKQLELFKSQLIELSIDTLKNSLNNQKSYTEHGYEFSLVQSGRYEYKSNHNYLRLRKEIKQLEEKMKIALAENTILIDRETGEVFPPAEYIPNKISIKITKKK